MGVRVLYHTSVGDSLGACSDVFRRAIDRADVVLITGGLGPTADDLTRQALAEATGRALRVDPKALEHVRAIFARRNRPMPPQNELQALIPDGGRMIDNPEGTAPGIELDVARDEEIGTVPGRGPCRVFALPGVPAEMRQMWHESVAVRIGEMTGGDARIIRHRKIKCFGAGESQIESMLPDLIRRGREPRVGITASQATIILRITAEGASEAACLAAMEPTVATIHECLGRLVFGEGDDELQDAVVRLLGQPKATLATAEWGTAGLIAEWLGGVPEGAGVYLGGVVVPSDAAAQRLLEVPRELLLLDPPASSEVAQAMAVGCRERFGADYALAVGRFPEGQSSDACPATFSVALASSGGVEVAALPVRRPPGAAEDLLREAGTQRGAAGVAGG